MLKKEIYSPFFINFIHCLTLNYLELMSKRIGFVCRQLVLKRPSGGIMNGILAAIRDLKSKGHHVDVITDKELKNDYFKNLDVRVIVVPSAISTRNHTDLFQFKDSLNFERCVLTREALKLAMTSAVYDVLICNELESTLTVYNLNLSDYIHVVNWMHEPGTYFNKGMKDVYTDAYFEMIYASVTLPIYQGCTTDRNKKELQSRIKETQGEFYTLEYPISELRMLEPNRILVDKKDGVLFNGRVETRKNPEVFIKTLVKIREKYSKELKAKVLTRDSHVEKFKELAKKYNYTNYEIKSDILGDEKFDFIESAKVGFAPSKQETFGIAAFESLRYHPTVLLTEYDWYKNFEGAYSNLYPSSMKEAVDLIWELHEADTYKYDENKTLQEFQFYQNTCLFNWLHLVNKKHIGEESSGENSNFIKNLRSIQDTERVISLKDYFERFNTKKIIYLSDIEALYYNRSKYKIVHLSEGSIVTSDKNLSDQEIISLYQQNKKVKEKSNSITEEFFN